MRTASWVLLVLVGVLFVLGGLASTYIAYSGSEDPLLPGGPMVQDLEPVHSGVASALRGRRATAAAFALAYGALFLSVVLVPYRRGEVWSWWALLASSALLGAVIVARVPALGSRLGAGTGLVQFGVVLLALLLDVRRLRPAGARPAGG
jgi:hypothetical protein